MLAVSVKLDVWEEESVFEVWTYVWEETGWKWKEVSVLVFGVGGRTDVVLIVGAWLLRGMVEERVRECSDEQRSFLYLLLLSVGESELLRFSKVGGNSVGLCCEISVVCAVALLNRDLDKTSGKLRGFSGSLLFKEEPYCCVNSRSDLCSGKSFICLRFWVPPCVIIRFMLPLQTDSVVFLLPLLLGIWLLNLLLSVKVGPAKALLLSQGGTKGVFGWSLMLVVSSGLKGELPSLVTCFHQEVDVSMVLLGRGWVFRRSVGLYGECLGEGIEPFWNRFGFVFEPLQICWLADGTLLRNACLEHVWGCWVKGVSFVSSFKGEVGKKCDSDTLLSRWLEDNGERTGPISGDLLEMDDGERTGFDLSCSLLLKKVWERCVGNKFPSWSLGAGFSPGNVGGALELLPLELFRLKDISRLLVVGLELKGDSGPWWPVCGFLLCSFGSKDWGESRSVFVVTGLKAPGTSFLLSVLIEFTSRETVWIIFL